MLPAGVGVRETGVSTDGASSGSIATQLKAMW